MSRQQLPPQIKKIECSTQNRQNCCAVPAYARRGGRPGRLAAAARCAAASKTSETLAMSWEGSLDEVAH